MDCRSNFTCIERSLCKWTRHFICLSSERIVSACLDLCIFSHCCFKYIRWNLEFCGKFRNCGTFCKESLLYITFNSLEGFTYILVEKNVCSLPLLFKDCLRHYVAGCHLSAESFSFTVHDDGTVSTYSFCDHGSIPWNYCRVSLNLIHLSKGGIEFLDHFKCITCSTSVVSCSESLEVWLVRDNHVRICSKTSGSNNHSLCLDHIITVLCAYLYTCRTSLFFDYVGYL